MREIVFALGPVPRRTVAGLLGAKDGVSCNVAMPISMMVPLVRQEDGRPETY